MSETLSYHSVRTANVARESVPAISSISSNELCNLNNCRTRVHTAITKTAVPKDRTEQNKNKNNEVYERRPCLASVPIKQTKLMNRQKKLTTT